MVAANIECIGFSVEQIPVMVPCGFKYLNILSPSIYSCCDRTVVKCQYFRMCEISMGRCYFGSGYLADSSSFRPRWFFGCLSLTRGLLVVDFTVNIC